MRFFSGLEWLAIVTVGVILTAMVTAGYVRSFDAGQVTHGRAMALAVLTLSSAAITAVLSGMRTLASRVVVMWHRRPFDRADPDPPLAALLSLTPLHGDDWLWQAALRPSRRRFSRASTECGADDPAGVGVRRPQ